MKIILIMLIALATSGCAVTTSHGRILMLQRGVILTLVHTCTDRAIVNQAGRGRVGEIVGATPDEFALQPVVPGERMIHVIVQSVDTDGKVAGVYSESFEIDRQSTTAQVWIIGNNNSSYGRGRRANCVR